VVATESFFSKGTRCLLIAGFAHLAVIGTAQSQEREPAKATSPGAKTNEYGTPITSAKEKVGLQSIAFRLGLYSKDDSGDGTSAGNPFLDEDLTVIQPSMIMDWGLDDVSALSVTAQYDWVSSASIERLSDRTTFPGTQQSGASGDFYVGLDVAYRRQLNNGMRGGGHVGFGKEYDYLSVGLGGDLAWEGPDRNSTYSASLNGYFDSVDLIRFNGVETGSDNRTSLAGTFKWNRVLDSASSMQLGVTVSNQSGFLGTPYNSVFIDEVGGLREVNEVLPDSRMRYSFYGSYRRWVMEGGAAEIATRVYNDDWGIFGLSLEPRWYQQVGEDLLMRFRYRYYDQSAADSFGLFSAEEPYMTQDSELGDFNSHTVGVRLIGYRDGLQGWDAGLDYVMRSDELDHIVASAGYLWTF